MFDGVVHERQVPGPHPTSQEKVLMVVFFLFLAVVVGGAIAVGVLESKNRTECGGAITNTPNAPKPVPPASKATAPRFTVTPRPGAAARAPERPSGTSLR